MPILRIWTGFFLKIVSHLCVVWERKWGHCLAVILLNVLIPAHIRRLNTWTGKGTVGYLFYRKESDLWIVLLRFQCYSCGVVIETHTLWYICVWHTLWQKGLRALPNTVTQAGYPFFTRLHWVPLFSPVYRNTEQIKEHKKQLIFKTKVRMNLSNAQNGEVCIKIVYIPNPFLTLPSTK